MLGRLLLLFTVVPLVEVYLLVTLGGLMGPWPTVGLVLVTGAVGAFLARHEGARVLREWREAVAQGELPEEGVVSSVLVLVGGVLLVTPGVITDVVGLSLLIPPSRRAIATVVKRRLEARMEIHTLSGADADAMHPMFGRLGDAPFGPGQRPGREAQPRPGRPRGPVIDVEARPSDGDGDGDGDGDEANRERSA